MTRWTGNWLLGGADPGGHGSGTGAGQEYPGQRLGLPEDGPGSVVGLPIRGLAFGVDVLLSALIAGLFTAPELPGNWSLLAWALLTAVPIAAFGMTPGMTLFGIRVARLGGATFVGIPRAVARTVLVFFLVPPLLTDADRRGLHDRLLGTVVVRSR